MPDEPFGQQVREGARQHDRLFVFLVIGRLEVDGVLADAFEQKRRDVGHARFGVAHRRRVIAVDIAEIALAIDDGVADGEFLRQAHQRIIDRLIAMRMELTHDVADDTGALLVGLVGPDPHFAHCMHDAAMHRLETVADIGQRALRDRR